MKQQLTQLETAAREVRLEHHEKAFMKQRLDAYMEEHPVRESPSGRQRMQLFITHHPMPIAVLALALLLGGGTSVVAAQALPGDTLYPMKTEVNEEVRGWFHFDAESKAEFEAKLAERRNEELERLRERRERAQENGEGLSDEARERSLTAREDAKARFEAHAEKMKQLAERLEAAGQTEAAARIRASLAHVIDVHADVRARMEARLEAANTQEERDAIREETRDRVQDIHERTQERRDEMRGEVTDRERDVQNRDTIRLHLRERFLLDANLDANTETDVGTETKATSDVDAEAETDAGSVKINSDVGASLDTQSSAGVSTSF